MSVRADWLAERGCYIGGSEIAAIAGLNPWKTPLSVYLSKTDPAYTDTAGIFAEMGLALEPLLKDLFKRETGLTVIDAPQHIRHSEYDFLGANPDGFILEDPDAMFEGKTFDYTVQAEFGEPGTDQVPIPHVCQCQWYMGKAKKKRCYLAALHRTTGKFFVYLLLFDIELYEMLVSAGVRFKNEHIIPRIPPEPQAGDLGLIRAKYPTDTGEMMLATSQIDEWAETMLQIHQEMSPLKKRFDDRKAKFMNAMEDAAVCATMIGNFTYRQAKPKKVTDWKAVAQEVAEGMPLAAAIEEFTTTKPGSRRFLTPFAKEEE